MKKIKIVLLGLLVEHSGRKSPCLSLYNLKAYAAADPSLRDNVDIKIYEQFVSHNPQIILNLLEQEKPDMIGLSCYLWSTDKLLSAVNQYCKNNKDVLVFLGGPDAGPNAEKLLNRHDFISGVIKGEGEEAFRLLLNDIVNNDDWRKTKNLICKVNNEIVVNQRLDEIEISKIPLAFKMDEFIENHGKWLYVETARGCKYNCAYCNFYNRNGKRRIRSYSEIEEMVNDFSADSGQDITFIDPGFNQDRERFHRVITLLSEKQIKVEGFEINIEELTDEDIKILAQITAGTMLGVGLQTTNKEALKIIGRAYNSERFKDRINKLKEVGVDYAIDIIFGLPGDNYESFKKTYNDAYSLKPAHVRVYNLLTLPDTRLFLDAEKHGLVSDTEAPYTTQYCNTFTQEDMKKARRFMNAHSTLSTYSSNSIALMLFADEINELPSSVVEDLLSGSWRNNLAVTDEELEFWKEMDNSDERAEAVRSFINYKYESKYLRKIPTALADLFELQFQTGSVNVSGEEIYKNKETVNFNSKHIYDKTPRLNNGVRILRLNTDVLKMFKERPRAKDVEFLNEFILVLFRTGTSIKYYKISKGVERLLNMADGQTSYGKMMESSLNASFSQDQNDLIKNKVNKSLSDLTEKQVLIWN
ncbi:MAG: radical SAM protein [bacterium]